MRQNFVYSQCVTVDRNRRSQLNREVFGGVKKNSQQYGSYYESEVADGQVSKCMETHQNWNTVLNLSVNISSVEIEH